ncbi:MAG: enoyl-CoA hydratase/isomerase family protein [Gaiella sp.]|nr:enoyl-CoA hydratase/isomerase family protein [Gaiella sp.]
MTSTTADFWRVTQATADGFCVVEFKRPPVNALSPEALMELSGLVRELDDDENVRAIVFTSAHPSIFMAGADLKHMQSVGFTDARVSERVDRVHGVYARLQKLSKPTIGALEGHALGGGCEFALSLDFRFMTRGFAGIGLPEVTLGLIPAAGGTQRLARLVGRTCAADMLMLGRRLDADEAEGIGLVTASDDARASALAYAEQLAAMPASSLRAIKLCLNEGYDGDLHRGLAVERTAAMQAFTSPEAAEGVSAFLDKRTPRFHTLRQEEINV